MRTLSFTNHLKLNVHGKVSQNCIAFGDVDADSSNELVVGISGLNGKTVLICKGNSNSAWYELNADVKSISCIAIGDVCNQKKNSIVIVSWCGCCSIMDINSSSGGITHNIKSTQLIPNVDNVLIGDLDNNGKYELIAGHSDKAVSAYRWMERLKKFVLLKRWKLNHLVGNVTLHVSSEKQQLPLLMASQSGCSFAILKFFDDNDECSHSVNASASIVGQVQYMELSSMSRLQNPNISSKILGGILKSSKNPSGYYALCTLDGTLKLMEGNENLWSVQVDHQLFAMNKLDVLGDNREEVIVCAWDGWTYIVDHDRNVVRYHFQDNVQAFCAGEYCVGPDNVNSPCLVYADFHGHLYVFFQVKLPFLHTTDFLSILDNDDFMSAYCKQSGVTTCEDKVKLVRSCLKPESNLSGTKILDET